MEIAVCIEKIKLILIFEISQCALSFHFHSVQETMSIYINYSTERKLVFYNLVFYIRYIENISSNIKTNKKRGRNNKIEI